MLCGRCGDQMHRNLCGADVDVMVPLDPQNPNTKFATEKRKCPCPDGITPEVLTCQLLSQICMQLAPIAKIATLMIEQSARGGGGGRGEIIVPGRG